MIRLKITNPNLSGEESTFLTTDYSTGAALTVRNSDQFTVNWFAVVGEPGQEQTEIKQVSSLASSTNITISGALSFTHPKSTPVYRSHYNQISIERKPSGGSYAEIVEGKINIEWDNSDRKTFATIDSGSSTDTFRWRFYNSVTGDYTAYSDELLGTGIRRNSLGYVLEQVLKNPLIDTVDTETMINYANDFQELVYDEVPKAWWWQREGALTSTSADGYVFAISDDFNDLLSVKFVLYRYVNGSINETYLLRYVPLNEFYNMKIDANQGTDDHARYWTFLPPDSNSIRGYIGIHPTSKTANCFIKPVYHVEPTSLSEFGDILLVPYPKAYIDYVLYRIFDDIKNDRTNADKYNARLSKSIWGIKNRARRQSGQPELFRFRGVRGWNKMYGGEGVRISEDARELYW